MSDTETNVDDFITLDIFDTNITPYWKYMDEFSPDEIYMGLMSYGMFTDKLPPIFTSKPFYEYCISKSTAKNKDSFIFENKQKPKQFITFENIKSINTPRLFAIPNPFAYHYLCNHIKEYWLAIQYHFKKYTENQTYKTSRVHIRKLGNENAKQLDMNGYYDSTEYSFDKIFAINSKYRKEDGTPENDLKIGNKYVVKADISTCFPSIYSHSISWALVGKEMAKKTKLEKELWYNQLDFYIRNLKNGETNGLLIGPHVSNLISEIILVVIDKNLLSKGYNHIRYIDDYTYYCSSKIRAEEFLTDLNMELGKFSLMLNHKKTQIEELPLTNYKPFVHKVPVIRSDTDVNPIKYPEIEAYTATVIREAEEAKDYSVLKYFMKVISTTKLTENAMRYYVKNIFHLSTIYPYIVPMLDDYVFTPLNASVNDIKYIANKIIDSYRSKRIFEPCCFAIYFSLKYNFHLLVSDSYKLAYESDDSLFILFCFLHDEKYKSSEHLSQYKELAKRFLKNSVDIERNWLFVYEALEKKELIQKNDSVDKSQTQHWRELKDNNISFIEDSLRIKSST